MVAATGYCVVYVRNKRTTIIIPSAQIVKGCVIPEDTLWVYCQVVVQLIIAQSNILNCCIYLDQHHSSIDGIITDSVIAGVIEETGVKAGVPCWHNIIKGE